MSDYLQSLVSLVEDFRTLECFELTYDFDSRVYIYLSCSLCDNMTYEMPDPTTIEDILLTITRHVLGNRRHML